MIRSHGRCMYVGEWHWQSRQISSRQGASTCRVPRDASPQTTPTSSDPPHSHGVIIAQPAGTLRGKLLSSAIWPSRRTQNCDTVRLKGALDTCRGTKHVRLLHASQPVPASSSGARCPLLLTKECSVLPKWEISVISDKASCTPSGPLYDEPTTWGEQTRLNYLISRNSCVAGETPCNCRRGDLIHSICGQR